MYGLKPSQYSWPNHSEKKQEIAMWVKRPKYLPLEACPRTWNSSTRDSAIELQCKLLTTHYSIVWHQHPITNKFSRVRVENRVLEEGNKEKEVLWGTVGKAVPLEQPGWGILGRLKLLVRSRGQRWLHGHVTNTFVQAPTLKRAYRGLMLCCLPSWNT